MNELATTPVDIIYGTVTGNAQDLAETFSERCHDRGIPSTLNAAEDWDLNRFGGGGRHVILIFSTWGDGEPPDDAIEFCEAIYEHRAPVHGVEYAVVALGDSAYDDFCGCGRRLDESLHAAGATRLMARTELDVDFAPDFESWMARYFELREQMRSLANVE